MNALALMQRLVDLGVPLDEAAFICERQFGATVTITRERKP